MHATGAQLHVLLLYTYKPKSAVISSYSTNQVDGIQALPSLPFSATCFAHQYIAIYDALEHHIVTTW